MSTIAEVTLSIPATTGNLGPGFDALGMALELRNEVTARAAGGRGGRMGLAVSGEGEEELAEPGRNRLVASLRGALEAEGLAGIDLEVAQRNRIPLRRGLGSSAAAAAAGALAGLLLARRLRGEPGAGPGLVSRALELALPSEGHADNLAPALVGGLCLCWKASETGSPSFLRLDPPPGLIAVLCVPAAELATADARRALPAAVPMADVVFSGGRSALLVAALLTGRYDLLAEAARDRVHQPYRIGLLPQMGAAIEAALGAGAIAAWVSGSGSTVLALCRDGDGETAARAGEAMASVWGPAARVVTAQLARDGAVIASPEGSEVRWQTDL
jgi:homoserine kinase